MAYSLVSAGTAVTGTTTITPAFGAGTTANHLLIAWLVFSDGTAVPATPSGWTRDVTSGPAGFGYALYSKIAAGSDTNPTFTEASSTAMAGCVAEFAGNATSSPLDQTGTGGSLTSPAVATAAANDAAALELLIGAQIDSYTKSGTTTTTHTWTDSGGAHPTANAIGNNDATSTAFHWRFSYAIATSATVTGKDALSAADTSKNLQAVNDVMASYKLAATSTGPLIPFRRVLQAVARASSY